MCFHGRPTGLNGEIACLARLLGSTSLVGLLCLLPSVLPAQTAAETGSASQDPIQLESVVVTGEYAAESPTGPGQGFVATRSATGSKTDTPVLEIPQSVSTVTADQMQARVVQSVGQALNYSAGVVAEPFGADPRTDVPIIRGFSAAESQYLNGLKLVREFGSTAIEPYGLERVEVLRGPSSVLYGQGNPGGMINLISKRPTWESFGEVNAEAGTFDRYTGSFDLGGPVGEGGQFAYRLTGLARDGGTQQRHVDDDRLFLAPALTWAPTDATSFTLLTSIQYDHPYSPMGLPNQYTVGPDSNRLGRRTYLGEPDFDSSNRTLGSIGYEFQHRFADRWTFRQNGRYLLLDWDYRSLYFSGLDPTNPTLANRGSSWNDENLNTFTLDNQVETSFATGPAGHTLLMGVDARYHDADTLTEFGLAPPVDVFDPQYGATITKDSLWYTEKDDGELTQIGAYAQDQVRWEQWLLTLGLRYDWAKANSTTTSNFGNTRQDQTDHAWTGRAGLTYLFGNGLAPYVSYATSFEPVIGNMPAALGGGAFKPSEGKQWEAGLKYRPEGWNGLFTAAIYDLRQTNVTSTELVNGVNETVQEGEVKVQGVELSGLASLMQGLDLILNYTYTDAEITAGDNSGNRPANVPEHSASAWLDYTIQTGMFEGLGFGGGVRYVGSRYDLNSNTTELDSNTLLDAAVHYDAGSYRASLNVNNLTDEKYVATCGNFGCFYGDGLTVTGRLTYAW
ncbi:TonB-dependent siderophore receptor [Geminicoccus flavidas]|uniref:TonB-dependent siderophore receptor n=1 Tax=Geminicoccus flavidas TaxID=2506407 RepID=UPI00135B5509|nr:TonB-dependent siderophore receptor [Geminicoccus flavidas]